MKRISTIAVILVVIHVIIAYVHGEAHLRLGVGLAPWQWAYVYLVILFAPLVAMMLYWTPWPATGAMLLAVSMTASFAFGVYHHFIAVSPDHVSHLPEGDARALFIASAILLAISEGVTAAFGFWSYVVIRQRYMPPDTAGGPGAN